MVPHLVALILTLPAVQQPAPRDASARPTPQAERSLEQLDRAHALYETQMEAMRTEVRALFAAAIDAENRGEDRDLDAVKALVAARDAFGTTAEWPEFDGIDALRQKEAKIARDLRDAYTAAYVACDRAARAELRQAVDTERELFATHIDRSAWIDIDLTAATVGREPTTEDAAAAAQRELHREFAAIQGHSYRLELRARRSGGDGPIVVDLPGARGSSHQVRIPTDANGACLATFTVDGATIVGTSGLPRPLPTTAVAADQPRLRIATDGGAVALESIRWKPLARGKVDEVATPDNVRKAPPPKTLLDYMPVGTRVTGNRSRPNDASLPVSGKVIANNGKQMTIRVTEEGKGVWDYVFEQVGPTTAKFLHMNKIKGNPPGSRKVKQLRLRINETGLRGSYGFDWAHGKDKGSVGGTLTLDVQ